MNTLDAVNHGKRKTHVCDLVVERSFASELKPALQWYPKMVNASHNKETWNGNKQGCKSNFPIMIGPKAKGSFDLREYHLSLYTISSIHVLFCYTNLWCHLFFFWSTANLWEISLDEVERSKAKAFNIKIACDVLEKENRKTSKLQFKRGPSCLTAFCERGHYSNHTHQPNVNHL